MRARTTTSLAILATLTVACSSVSLETRAPAGLAGPAPGPARWSHDTKG